MESSSSNSQFKVNLYGKTGAGKSTLCNIILGREEFQVGKSLKSCTTVSQNRIVQWQGFPPVVLTDTPGFADNRVKERPKQIAQIVKETSQGLNMALFLISITGARFDDADTIAIQQIIHLLTKDGVPHIYLIFTQVDNLAKEVQTEAISQWTTSSFDILQENNVKLSQENFYVLRIGQQSEFIAWLKGKLKSLGYFKPPQYQDLQELIKSCNGDDMKIYVGLGQRHERIAQIEAERVLRLKEEMEELKEAAEYSEKARKDLETAVKNLQADKESFEEAEKFFGGKLNYQWSNSSFDAIRGWVHNGEGGEAGKYAKGVVGGVAQFGVIALETTANIVKAPFSGAAKLLKWFNF